jgi:hypothetical protein
MIIAVAGCKDESVYGEVQGVVTLDGKRLTDVEVVFLPDPEKGTSGQRSVALADAQGRYRIASDAGRGGAPVGFHRVCINDLLASPAQPEKQGKSRFPAEYSSARSTPLRDIEVKPGAQTIDLKVKRRLPQ